MYKTEQEIVLDKIKAYEDLVTFDQFKNDVLTAYNLIGNKKAEELVLISWRDKPELYDALDNFERYVKLVRE